MQQVAKIRTDSSNPAQTQKPAIIHVAICGNVDDGKSTLIGRLLWETDHIYSDQWKNLLQISRKHGAQGNQPDFALLLDGLIAEQEQGITIDVAYRSFSTQNRRYLIADAPGHEQYTRNMVTACSNASLAILLVDITKGLKPQTFRHATIASLLGVQNVIVAVNKMDLAGYNKKRFYEIDDAFRSYAKNLDFKEIQVIPVSALKGDNVVAHTHRMRWYKGKTLLACMDSLNTHQPDPYTLCYPIQYTTKVAPDIRGYAGTLSSGKVQKGQQVVSVISGQTARVSRILAYNIELETACAKDPVTLTLDREIDLSRGDILAGIADDIETTTQFACTLIWLGDQSGLRGRSYDIKLATQTATATLTSIKSRLDPITLSHAPSHIIHANDICDCVLTTNRKLCLTGYKTLPSLGSFILIDRITQQTIAAGMVNHTMRRASNIHFHPHAVTRTHRESAKNHKGSVIWLTGLSGSGKSVTANALEVILHKEGFHTSILDGDNVRLGLNKDLGFTESDRIENVRRLAEVAKLMLDAGLVVIVCAISPFVSDREMAKELIGKGDFIEVYVRTPLDVCIKRDPKGLYKKAMLGLIPNMTGIGSPYEPPTKADIEITTTEASPNDIATDLYKKIVDRLRLQEQE